MARNNKKEEAVAAATKAAALAKAAGNMDYVKLNEQLIASLK